MPISLRRIISHLTLPKMIYLRAKDNLFRYRSYIYDDEMSMCYLQSRYYITTFGRFLNSDLPEYAQVQKNDNAGLNLFAYCCNDPVNKTDQSGNLCISSLPSAIAYFMSGYLLRNCKSIHYSEFKRDKYNLYSTKVSFYKGKKKYKIKATFGMKNAWNNSVKNISSVKVMCEFYYGSYFDNLSNNNTADPDHAYANLGSAFACAVMTIFNLTNYYKISIIKKYINVVWGKTGLDTKNNKTYCLVNITDNKSYNGWYVFKLTGGGYKRL